MTNKGPDPIKNVYMMEFLGTDLDVLDHTDPGLIGISGSVEKETMNTFLIQTGGKKRMVPKKGGIFNIMVEKEGEHVHVRIYGDDILFRPVDRTKKCERKRPAQNTNDNHPESSYPN